jgi:hypothetical protein
MVDTNSQANTSKSRGGSPMKRTLIRRGLTNTIVGSSPFGTNQIGNSPFGSNIKAKELPIRSPECSPLTRAETVHGSPARKGPGHSEVMMQRWHVALVNAKVPEMDITDQLAVGKSQQTKVPQFWAEYSQTSYEEAFSKQKIVFDYTAESYTAIPKLKINSKQREGIVALISELHKQKNYRKETLFIAFGLLDRYLALVVRDGLLLPELDLVHLAAVCLLMAAKLHQPLTPSFNQMILLLDEDYRKDPLCKKQMIELEFSMVKQLQFDVQIQTPLVFLGRYLMFFCRKVKSASRCQAIEHTAQQFLKFTAYKSDYLAFKPSHQAAVVSILTANIYTSDAAIELALSKSAS